MFEVFGFFWLLLMVARRGGIALVKTAVEVRGKGVGVGTRIVLTLRTNGSDSVN